MDKSIYCPTCGALVLEEGMCELCRLALDRLVAKRLGGVDGKCLK